MSATAILKVPNLRSVLLILVLGLSLNLSGCGLFKPDVKEPNPKVCKLVVKTAYCQVGKQYRSGGASPSKGFDCSGLVYFIYQKNGYKIPRITTEQAKFGKRIPKDSLREGDILVFRMNNSPRGLHTAIYTGDRCFIHSPSSGKKVKRDSVEKPYWKDRLIGVRRVIQ
ncbi:MAG: C40 family peptidase [Desulfovibrionaceae bacterium]|nr:C40 family peptidase [Desulfovibrionaceae bacterium]